MNNEQEPALPSPAVRIQSEHPPQFWIVTSSQSLTAAASDISSNWGMMHLQRSCLTSVTLWLQWLKVKERNSDQGASSALEPAKETPAL